MSHLKWVLKNVIEMQIEKHELEMFSEIQVLVEITKCLKHIESVF